MFSDCIQLAFYISKRQITYRIQLEEACLLLRKHRRYSDLIYCK